MKQTKTSNISFSEANKTLKIAIVRSNYHGDLTQSMTDLCIKKLTQAGVLGENISTFEAPGAWELPILIKQVIEQGFDGIAAFGVIIKGETYHFEMLANQVSAALMNLSLENNLPIAMEVLAVYSLKQAEERTTGKGNKGQEAAQALLSVINQISL